MSPIPEPSIDIDDFEKFLQQPRTVEDLMEKFSLSERSTYRYLKVLEEMEVRLVRLGAGRPTKYQVLRGSGK